MAYELHFFSMPARQVQGLPEDPASVRDFLRRHGKPLGALSFQPGESTLFLGAAGELTELELMDLLESPLGPSEPTESGLFGGLDHEAARQALGALDAVLAQMGEATSGFVELAESHDFTPQRLLELLKDLRQLISDAIEAGGDLVTLYS